ncbi:MAG TPA: M20/M25/M40 family metallo-hydrolase, partial [Candidatus Korarchaeota archaeon]|nr:M20/M25/M40 family metallo-hydrolase [Candidatus Korarchaeota archaeon]
MLDEVVAKVESLRDEMVSTMLELIPLGGIGPENGGEGELAKAEFLEGLLRRIGVDEIERHDARDDRVPSGVRPNIVARLRGEERKTVWIVSHMDVVPPGDLSLWESDPFKPVVRDGRIYGRGSEDDGQGIVSSIYAAKALLELGVKPKLTLGLALVSDEETGNRFGISHLIS